MHCQKLSTLHCSTVILLLYILSGAQACSPIPSCCCDKGVFVRSLQTTTDPNFLWASVDVHDGSCEDAVPTTALIDLQTQTMAHQISLPDGVAIRVPPTPVRSDTDYTLVRDGDNAVLLDRSNNNMTVVAIPHSGQSLLWWVDNEIAYFATYPQRSVWLYNMQDASVRTVFQGFDAIAPPEATETAVDYIPDLDVVLVKGASSLCRNQVLYYYNSTAVVERASTSILYQQDLLDSFQGDNGLITFRQSTEPSVPFSECPVNKTDCTNQPGQVFVTETDLVTGRVVAERSIATLDDSFDGVTAPVPTPLPSSTAVSLTDLPSQQPVEAPTDNATSGAAVGRMIVNSCIGVLLLVCFWGAAGIDSSFV